MGVERLSVVNRQATLDKYGYDVHDLKPKSNKKVVVVCSSCNAVRETAWCQVKEHCLSCSVKASWNLKGTDRVQKCRQTVRKNYGDEGFRSARIVEKTKTTKTLRYGEDWAQKQYAKSLPAKIAKYGERWRANDLIKQKAIATLKKNYPTGFKDPGIRERVLATNLERHGTAYPGHYGKAELALAEEIRSWGLEVQTQQTINKKSIDIFLPGKNLAIEYNGLFWHHEASPTPRTRQYHLDKLLACESVGIRLIHIFEDEWKTRRQQVLGFLKSTVGTYTEREQARRCKVELITKETALRFFEENHIIGENPQMLVAWGLFTKERLVGAVSISKHHRQGHEGTYVLDRLCFKHGWQVVGGASKLLKPLIEYARNENASTVVSWSDRRWSQGNVYKALGFEKVAVLAPDYTYVDINMPRVRLSKQSQKKGSTNCPVDLTEYQWATERGLSRIWDCGKIRWEIRLT